MEPINEGLKWAAKAKELLDQLIRNPEGGVFAFNDTIVEARDAVEKAVDSLSKCST